MLDLARRAIPAVALTVALLVPLGRAPAARAQAPEAPVALLLDVFSPGDGLGMATLVIDNQLAEPLAQVEIRCILDPSWTVLGSWTGGTPGDNPAALSLEPVADQDDTVAIRPILNWISLYAAAGARTGPFNYTFDTHGLAGATWCSGAVKSNGFSGTVVSDAFAYSPGPPVDVPAE
jgi:hypothetical protein